MSVVFQEFPLKEEYAKQTGITPQDISKLREWLLTQPHLPGDHITDLELILTYHCCDRSTEVSKQVLDLHFTLRTLFSSFFKDRTVDAKVEHVLRSMLLTILPQRTKEGYVVFYAYFLNSDPKHFVLADVFRVGLMVLDLFQYAQGTWPGFLIVFDLERMTLGYLSRLDVQSVQQYLYYLQEAMLVILKGIHYINAPPFMDRILMLMKPFLKNALLEKLYVHQVGARTLDQFYPLEALPGGTIWGKEKSLQEFQDEMLKTVKTNAEFFVRENWKRVVEARRPGKPKTISDIFGGVEGSFKKLDID